MYCNAIRGCVSRVRSQHAQKIEKFGHVVFELCQSTDKQWHLSQYFAPTRERILNIYSPDGSTTEGHWNMIARSSGLLSACTGPCDNDISGLLLMHNSKRELHILSGRFSREASLWYLWIKLSYSADGLPVTDKTPSQNWRLSSLGCCYRWKKHFHPTRQFGDNYDNRMHRGQKDYLAAKYILGHAVLYLSLF